MVDLTLEGVGKRYDGTTALADVSFRVEEGEFFTLVGPSGCGKTTTLRLLAGFEVPDEGIIRFDGESVGDRSPETRDIGIVFQNYALFPTMSVRENIAYGLQFRDGYDTEARVTELLELVGLDGMGNRDPTALSGGQQQRVALARALAPEPGLLLLDEPMSALDARLRERLRREVRAIQQELDVTTVYVTHDQAEALAVSDRLAVLSEGRIQQVGTPEEVYDAPGTRFVAEFVGENNVLDARVISRNVDSVTVRILGTDTEVRLPPVDGQQVTFCVRPERLQVGSGENRLETTVKYTEFLGDAVRVGLSWEGRELVVKTTAAPTGDHLVVGFDPGDVVVV